MAGRRGSYRLGLWKPALPIAKHANFLWASSRARNWRSKSKKSNLNVLQASPLLVASVTVAVCKARELSVGQAAEQGVSAQSQRNEHSNVLQASPLHIEARQNSIWQAVQGETLQRYSHRGQEQAAQN